MLYILAFYSVYSFIRNKGVAGDSVDVARHHALSVIHIERVLGSFHEETIQDWFLRWPNFIKFWNVYYGSFHFIVTVVALVYMFRRMSARYPLWRNTLAITTGLALFGFAFYPLMPPRLLPSSYGFVDTLKVVGGLWSFDSGPVAKVSNQYAAMPSLHFAWSAWCMFVLWPALRRPWAKAIMAIYPFLTLFAIVVTANHYWLDAAGGAVTLSAGFVLGRSLTRYLADRGEQPAPDPEQGIEPAEAVDEPDAPVAVPAADGGEVPAEPEPAVADGEPAEGAAPTPDHLRAPADVEPTAYETPAAVVEPVQPDPGAQEGEPAAPAPGAPVRVPAPRGRRARARRRRRSA